MCILVYYSVVSWFDPVEGKGREMCRVDVQKIGQAPGRRHRFAVPGSHRQRSRGRCDGLQQGTGQGVPTVLEQKTTICCKYLSLHGLAIVAVPKKALRHPVYGTSTPLTRLIDIAHPFFRVQKLAHARICHSLK